MALGSTVPADDDVVLAGILFALALAGTASRSVRTAPRPEELAATL